MSELTSMAADADRESALRRAENKIKGLERKNRLLMELLSRSRGKPRTVRVNPSRTRTKGESVRVIIPDSHGSAIDPVAAGAFLADLKKLDPNEIVMGGDHVDCGGFLAQHHVLGYVAQADYSYEDDLQSANHFLDQIQAAAPRATIHMIEGNHERRTETWAVTESLRNQKDADWLRKLVSPEFQLKLKERGIRYYRQSEHYDGIRIPGAIKLGKCYFWHSVSTAKNAAQVNLQQFGANVVYFHTHREDSASGVPVGLGDIGAWNPGCLCLRQPLWQHTRPTNWTSGFGVQLVARSGNFLHINCRIVEGQSLLLPLLNQKNGLKGARHEDEGIS